MGPSKDTFALCATLMFCVLCLVLIMSGNPFIRNMAVLALWGGTMSQWVAQDDNRGMWLVSRILAYMSALSVFAAISVYMWP